MDISLDGLYAVITGASSGLGFAMAEALLENGATVALASRSGEKLDKAVDARVDGFMGHPMEMDIRGGIHP